MCYLADLVHFEKLTPLTGGHIILGRHIGFGTGFKMAQKLIVSSMAYSTKCNDSAIETEYAFIFLLI